MSWNKQSPEKLVPLPHSITFKAGRCPDLETVSLEVVGVWKTIQGEGPYAGRPAVFVRLAGCNLACPNCDTNYTEGRLSCTVSSLLIRIVGTCSPFFRYGSPGVPSRAQMPLVVITGGEPFRQASVLVLAEALLNLGFTVQIETNGTLVADVVILHELQQKFSPSWNVLDLDKPRFVVVCSPKAPKVHSDWARIVQVDCWKYVLSHDNVSTMDGLPTSVLGSKIIPARPPADTSVNKIYVQPEDTGTVEGNARNVQAVVKTCLQFGYQLSVQVHKFVGVD